MPPNSPIKYRPRPTNNRQTPPSWTVCFKEISLTVVVVPYYLPYVERWIVCAHISRTPYAQIDTPNPCEMVDSCPVISVTILPSPIEAYGTAPSPQIFGPPGHK